MNIELEPLQARVIGALIEKQITTPDQYPLSLNALVNACNQKSNRDPVISVDEATVQRTLDTLSKRHLVTERSGFGSRVPKYQHRFCNTEFGSLKFDAQELAVVCELLLRGAQTPGELRQRASRMASFSDVTEVEAVLERLATRDDGPFVMRLAREPGRREARYAHLFSGPPKDAVGAQATVAQSGSAAASVTGAEDSGRASTVAAPEVSFPASRTEQRLTELENEMRALRAELEDVKRRLNS
ncbi:MAG: DUF480 domain-containing protein [Sinobacteraceae bacterium]|nr:DUF480 domain-containing protein [Nevskiaceae bacterium]MBV9914693.1 DUF480 domain-containing protein [Nevskiaceae bacterium]